VARDPEDIELEIEQAREALAATLDELSQRANPKRFVESGKASVRSTLEDPRVRYPLIAVGALIALLMVRWMFR
jgi:type VI protein secretion system component VasF